jgi:hypothetical protein
MFGRQVVGFIMLLEGKIAEWPAAMKARRGRQSPGHPRASHPRLSFRFYRIRVRQHDSAAHVGRRPAT